MVYTKQTWDNGEDGGTPLSAKRLNHMEQGIKEASDTAEAKQQKGDPGDAGDDGRGVESVSGEKSGDDFKITFTMTKGGDETVTIKDVYATDGGSGS